MFQNAKGGNIQLELIDVNFGNFFTVYYYLAYTIHIAYSLYLTIELNHSLQ